jgi:hypothetical protein
LRSGRCTPAVRAAKTTAVSIGPIVTKTVTNAERRFGGKIIPYPNCDAVDRLRPFGDRVRIGEKSASEGLDVFLAFLIFSRRAPQGSTTVRGHAVGGGFAGSSLGDVLHLGCMSHLSESAQFEPAVRDVNY